MRYTRSFQASPHCLPSPDGTLVANLSASTINVRAVASLHTVRDINLPNTFSGPVVSFQWSSSSRLLLVASVDEIHVLSASDGDFHATVRNPVPPAARLVYIGLGAVDTDLCVCTSLGLKFAILDLASSRTIEVANPKFYATSSVRRGFCFRPGTRHLTVLTRMSGKDMISIHHSTTKEVQRSWFPDTLDAQGIIWSSDGRWLVTWESAAHGHKVLFYTPDGNMFKAWSGPQALVPADADAQFGPGVRLLEFSADGRNMAIGDSSRRICILNTTSVTESLRLQHPSSIAATDTLQVWQEQASGTTGHQFVKALQTVYPPNGQIGANSPTQSGCVFMSFDPSSVLLATKLEDTPSTIWIWDVTTAELRAVLMFHENVSHISWHPIIRETLLITCDGDAYNSVVFLWDPLSEGPKPVDFSEHLSRGKLQAIWLKLDNTDPGALFVSDGKEYLLASLAEGEDGALPWLDDSEISGLLSSARSQYPTGPDAYDEEPSELDDTFCFKRT